MTKAKTKEVKTILSIDLGGTCGAVVSIYGEVEHWEEHDLKGLLGLKKFVEGLIEIWSPDLILIPFPTNFYRVLISHAKMMGIIEMIAELKNIPVIEVNDSHCKKEVLGKGNATKIDIAAFYKDKHPKIDSEHVRDAVMFIDAYLKEIEAGNYI